MRKFLGIETDESFSDPLYLQHPLGGIEYAMGKNISITSHNQ